MSGFLINLETIFGVITNVKLNHIHASAETKSLRDVGLLMTEYLLLYVGENEYYERETERIVRYYGCSEVQAKEIAWYRTTVGWYDDGEKRFLEKISE